MSYIDHQLFTDPPSHNKIWCYIALCKFESILQKQALFFCRADHFIDPFEGSLPKREFEYREQEAIELMRIYGIRPYREKAEQKAKGLSSFQKKLTELTVINCWHYNETESDAMWQLYLKDNRGVAIQSNCQRIKRAFRDTKEEILIGKVRYIDYIDYEKGIFYDRDEFPHSTFTTFTPFIHKRLHFKHEQEYCALTEVESHSNFKHDWSIEESENGKFIDVNVEELIEKVIVPPKADSKIIEKVMGLNMHEVLSKKLNPPYRILLGPGPSNLHPRVKQAIVDRQR